jgi:hypothetical protein
MNNVAGAQKALVEKKRPWLFKNPLADVLLICALFWPVALVICPFGATFDWMSTIVYMAIVTPHRWVTLLLVFLDPDQYERRPKTYTRMLVGTFALCLGAIVLGRSLGVGLEGFYLLLMCDYLWNTWHFASQYHGIYRIYGRRSGRKPMPSETIERWAFRLFCIYVLLRVGAATLFEDKDFGHYMGWLQGPLHDAWYLDLVALVVPVWLLLREFTCLSIVSSRALYLVSVLTAYTGLLLSVLGMQTFGLDMAAVPLAAFALAVSAFHSVEYLGIVSWSVRGKRAPRGRFVQIVHKWPLVLGLTITVVAMTQAVVISIGEAAVLWWLGVNLSVSFLHYAYDGMIWKRPKPAS